MVCVLYLTFHKNMPDTFTFPYAPPPIKNFSNCEKRTPSLSSLYKMSVQEAHWSFRIIFSSFMICLLTPPLGGATYKEILKDLLSETHFFEIWVKKSTKMGVPGRKSPWGSPIYPNKPPDDLHRAFLVSKKSIFCEKTPQNCVTLGGQNFALAKKFLQSDKTPSKHPKNTSVHIRWGPRVEIYGFCSF